jgi:hypothetical protein
MAKSTLGTDKFVQVVGRSVSVTAGAVPSNSQIVFGLSILDKVGVLIHRVDFDVEVSPPLPAAPVRGKIVFGISAVSMSTQVEVENDNNPAWVVRRTIMEEIDNGGVAVGEARNVWPTLVADFSTLPGGAIITPPSTVFLTGWAITGTSGVVIVVRSRLYYTITELSTEDYWQLVEARRMIPQ